MIHLSVKISFQFIGTPGSIVLQRVIFPCSLLFPSAVVYCICFHLCSKTIDGRNWNFNLFQLRQVVSKCKDIVCESEGSLQVSEGSLYAKSRLIMTITGFFFQCTLYMYHR